MKKIIIFYILFCFYILELNAQNVQLIDSIQKNISNKVVNLASSIDTVLSNSYDKNTTDASTNFFDIFFQNKKFIDETDKSYVSIQFNNTFQSRASRTSDISINAHIALSKTQHKFNLFMHTVENGQIFTSSTQSPADQRSNKQELGISYLAKLYHGIESKYSLGIRNLNPFLRARYHKVFTQGQWRIEPAQQFELSTKDVFKEQTNLYFDTKLSKTSLFRTTLQRETMSKLSGMNYSVSFTYFQTLSKKRAFNLTQALRGNTKYKYKSDVAPYAGVYEYITALNYRQYIWKKWLVYELTPALSFHKQYKYKANYILGFNFYIYFQK